MFTIALATLARGKAIAPIQTALLVGYCRGSYCHTAAWLIVVVFVSPIVEMPRARPVKWDGVVPFSSNSVAALRGSYGKC